MSIQERLNTAFAVLRQKEIICGSDREGTVKVLLTGRNLAEAVCKGSIAHLDGVVTERGKQIVPGQEVLVSLQYGGMLRDTASSHEDIATWAAHKVLTNRTGIKHGA